MSKKRLTATARATITIEIGSLGSWGPDCSADQIHRQAGQAARARVLDVFQREGRQVRIIDCKVTAVLVDEP